MKLDNIRGAEVIQVIRTETIRGKGEDNDPCRLVLMYWSLDGNWLAERDTWKEENDPKTNT